MTEMNLAEELDLAEAGCLASQNYREIAEDEKESGSSSSSTCNGTNKSQTLNDPRSSTLSSGGATSNGSAKISGSIVVENDTEAENRSESSPSRSANRSRATPAFSTPYSVSQAGVITRMQLINSVSGTASSSSSSGKSQCRETGMQVCDASNINFKVSKPASSPIKSPFSTGQNSDHRSSAIRPITTVLTSNTDNSINTAESRSNDIACHSDVNDNGPNFSINIEQEMAFSFSDPLNVISGAEQKDDVGDSQAKEEEHEQPFARLNSHMLITPSNNVNNVSQNGQSTCSSVATPSLFSNFSFKPLFQMNQTCNFLGNRDLDSNQFISAEFVSNILGATNPAISRQNTTRLNAVTTNNGNNHLKNLLNSDKSSSSSSASTFYQPMISGFCKPKSNTTQYRDNEDAIAQSSDSEESQTTKAAQSTKSAQNSIPQRFNITSPEQRTLDIFRTARAKERHDAASKILDTMNFANPNFCGTSQDAKKASSNSHTSRSQQKLFLNFKSSSSSNDNNTSVPVNKTSSLGKETTLVSSSVNNNQEAQPTPTLHDQLLQDLRDATATFLPTDFSGEVNAFPMPECLMSDTVRFISSVNTSNITPLSAAALKERENDRLQNKINKLMTTKNSLLSEIKEVKVNNEGFESLVKDLRNDVNKLNTENNLLREKVRQAKIKLETAVVLQDAVFRFTIKHGQLKAENNSLRTENKQLVKDIDNLLEFYSAKLTRQAERAAQKAEKKAASKKSKEEEEEGMESEANNGPENQDQEHVSASNLINEDDRDSLFFMSEEEALHHPAVASIMAAEAAAADSNDMHIDDDPHPPSQLIDNDIDSGNGADENCECDDDNDDDDETESADESEDDGDDDDDNDDSQDEDYRDDDDSGDNDDEDDDTADSNNNSENTETSDENSNGDPDPDHDPPNPDQDDCYEYDPSREDEEYSTGESDNNLKKTHDHPTYQFTVLDLSNSGRKKISYSSKSNETHQLSEDGGIKTEQHALHLSGGEREFSGDGDQSISKRKYWRDTCLDLSNRRADMPSEGHNKTTVNGDCGTMEYTDSVLDLSTSINIQALCDDDTEVLDLSISKKSNCFNPEALFNVNVVASMETCSEKNRHDKRLNGLDLSANSPVWDFFRNIHKEEDFSGVKNGGENSHEALDLTVNKETQCNTIRIKDNVNVKQSTDCNNVPEKSKIRTVEENQIAPDAKCKQSQKFGNRISKIRKISRPDISKDPCSYPYVGMKVDTNTLKNTQTFTKVDHLKTNETFNHSSKTPTFSPQNIVSYKQLVADGVCKRQQLHNSCRRGSEQPLAKKSRCCSPLYGDGSEVICT